MSSAVLRIPPDDLDEACIHFYRLWTRALLGEDPEALVLKEPEYVVIGKAWTLYCCRTPVNEEQVGLVASDTGRLVVCAAPELPHHLNGVDVRTGDFRGTENQRRLVEVLARAAVELPRASKGRDPRVGRWISRSCGAYEVWVGRQARLICTGATGDEVGYTWEPSRSDLFFYRSKSCKREGKRTHSGHFKLSEQKREAGRSYLNLDLLSESRDQAALIRLTPTGAGYKVFPRQVPRSFQVIDLFYG